MTANWRDGDGFTVSIDPAQGLFYDHRDGKGGDVFDLVALNLGCGFRDSLTWLADFYGIELANQTPQAVQRLHRVRNAATELAEWRWCYAQFLRAVRNRIWSGCRRVGRWADAQAGFTEDPGWSKFAQAPEKFRLADGIDQYIARLEQLPAADLIALRNRLEGPHAS